MKYYRCITVWIDTRTRHTFERHEERRHQSSRTARRMQERINRWSTRAPWKPRSIRVRLSKR